jgi:hypothetical protein
MIRAMSRGPDKRRERGVDPDEEKLDKELEQTELARRLRDLDWPEAPADVKERGLQEIMERVSRE